MKNNKDYIYEYSDLNLFQTRVKLLSGLYKDVILEFGASFVEQSKDVKNFTFDYTLYAKPERLNTVTLIGDKLFEDHLQKVLISIISHRNKSSREYSKLMQAASQEGAKSKIKIDEKFYNKACIPVNYEVIDF